MRNLSANLCLLLVACVAGLVLCEISLRLFYPKYRHLAEARLHREGLRIWTRTRNSRDWQAHPDTRRPYFAYHNNLALRQHRNFSKADLDSATNIGFFGDSFVENIRLPAPYSFTEPLDYLLNQHGERFNVLNFGTEGYGPGQSLLSYEHFRHAADIDHVFYVYCRNDLWDIYATGLFHLDDTGKLVRNEAIRPRWWVPLVSRLHTPYLVLDASGRLSSFLAEITANNEYRPGREERLNDQRHDAMRRAFRQGRLALDDQKNSLEIFRLLIRRWKHRAEHNGHTFSVVLLPRHPPQPFVVDLLNAEAVEVIDLFDCFTGFDAAHSQRHWRHSPYRFENDPHWNEAGNRLAAVCLYQVLEEDLRLPALSEEDLQAVLHRYYAAFEGGRPADGRRGGGFSLQTTAGILEKYEALDTLALVREDLEELTAAPGTRILASDFDVYLDGRRVVYIKEGCRPTDLQNPFFLNIVPTDENDLPGSRIPYGYVSYLYYKHHFRLGIDRGRCLATAHLPDYPLRSLWTGQFVWGRGLLWEGTFAIDPDSSGEGKEKFLPTTGKRMIASDFDVYLDGRDLIYVQEKCRMSDLEKMFFLHIIPVDQDALPPDRVQYGFDNLDFVGRDFETNEFGCRITRRLPDYAIRHVRTGQHLPDEGRLWEGEFTMESGADDGERRTGN